ncbi:hypothetical protein R9X47_00060 [Wukongibacter baidiensis]|uniref:hypothetical protein n=1 Tax=Wukongibacter baidiensis TaxID=1723361 RepID=UPI003D7F7DD6
MDDKDNKEIEFSVEEKENKIVTDIDKRTILKRIKKLEVLNYIIILLLGIMIISNFFNFRTPVADEKNEKELPSIINKEARNNLINEVKKYYNNDEREKFYNVLGDYAKTFISYEEFKVNIKRINDFAGKIHNATYTHYEYLGNQDSADLFNLKYAAKFDNGNGTIRLTIMVKNNEWELNGFRFDIDNIIKN